MRKMCTLITSKGTDIDENIANQNHATRTRKPKPGYLNLSIKITITVRIRSLLRTRRSTTVHSISRSNLPRDNQMSIKLNILMSRNS